MPYPGKDRRRSVHNVHCNTTRRYWRLSAHLVSALAAPVHLRQ